MVLLALTLLLGVAMLIAVGFATTSNWLSGYLSTSSLALWVGLSAGIGLIASGGVESLRRPRGHTGLLFLTIGVAWLAIEIVGWTAGPQLVRTMGLVLGPFLVPGIVFLCFTYPGNRIIEPLNRRLLVFLFVSALVVGVGRAIFYDPFLDIDCWRTCVHSKLVPFPNAALASGLDATWLGVAMASALGAVVIVSRRVVIAAKSGGTWAWYVLIPAALAAGGLPAAPTLLAVSPSGQPLADWHRAAFIFEAIALNATWLGAAWGMTLIRRTNRRLRTLAADLESAPIPGALRDLLAASLGDDTLEVAYWLPEVGGHITPDGQVTEVSPSLDRAIASIERGGETLGLVTHRSNLAAADLERQIGSAARLAIDNERLRAGLLAEMTQLRISQQKIVETADATRRRIERDLHDGAQQRLLALSYDLRLALAAAEETVDPIGPIILESIDDVRSALAELRELAHGIFPSILIDAGLAAALDGLGETAPFPVEMEVTFERFPEAVEMCAYQTTYEIIALAHDTGARAVTVSALRIVDDLVVDIKVDGGRLVADDLIRVGDRVGAAGGNVSVDHHRVRAVIPCA